MAQCRASRPCHGPTTHRPSIRDMRGGLAQLVLAAQCPYPCVATGWGAQVPHMGWATHASGCKAEAWCRQAWDSAGRSLLWAQTCTSPQASPSLPPVDPCAPYLYLHWRTELPASPVSRLHHIKGLLSMLAILLLAAVTLLSHTRIHTYTRTRAHACACTHVHLTPHPHTHCCTSSQNCLCWGSSGGRLSEFLPPPAPAAAPASSSAAGAEGLTSSDSSIMAGPRNRSSSTPCTAIF